jgi:hypothetical protein
MYAGSPPLFRGGVSTRLGSSIPTVPHDGVHTWPVAWPPPHTHARAAARAVWWRPLLAPTEDSHTTHARCGYLTWPTSCAVINPMPCAVMLVFVQCSLSVQSVPSPLTMPIVVRVAHHCLKGRPPYRRDPTGSTPCVVIFMTPCGVNSRPQPEDPFWPYSWPLGCSQLAQRTYTEYVRG